MRNRLFGAPFGVCLKRGCSGALMLGMLLSGVVRSHGQSAAGTPPPPAHLPPLLGECEAGQNYNACTIWIWHGSSYSATWSTGAVGQLTVASGNAADLRIERTDTAGPVTGLTATYTGHWTGSAVTDAKMTFQFKGVSGEDTWTVTPALTPVISQPDSGYVNWYSAQLTGYAMNNSKLPYGGVLGVLIDDIRMSGGGLISPGEHRQFTLRPLGVLPATNDPDHAAVAAVYSDGTTFGNASVLKVMMQHRREMIDALTSIGTTLCQVGMQQGSKQDMDAAIDKLHAELSAKSAANNEGLSTAFYFVGKALAGRDESRMTASQEAKFIFNEVNERRSGLAADPVKDASGQLAIPAVTPLQCSLP